MGFHKFSDPKTAGIASCFLCGQCMVGADGFVAIGDICACSEKKGSVVGHSFEEPKVVICHDLYMFESDAF